MSSDGQLVDHQPVTPARRRRAAAPDDTTFPHDAPAVTPSRRRDASDAEGIKDGAGLGLWLRPDDMVRLGQLLLAKGKWGGRRVLSADWCRALADPTGKRPAPWGLAGSRHGLAWYSATCKGQAVTYAMGYGGQYILLLPQRQRLIVVQHAHDTPRGIENNTFFLEKLLPRLVAFAEKP